MRSIACIGECMVELAESPDSTLTRSFGGDTLNTAVYLARLGVRTEYVTVLGTDPFSDEMLATWQVEGIGTRLVPRVPGCLPGLYLIRTNLSGERQFYYWRDAAPVRKLFDLPQRAEIEAALCQVSMIYLSGITLSLFESSSRDRLFQALAHARACGARIVFDMNVRQAGWPDASVARAVYDRAFRNSDLVLASVEDYGLLHGSSDLHAILDHLRTAGVSETVVKLATPACHVLVDGVAEIVTAPTVSQVIDTTAAGDSFAAAYIAARSAGLDARTAAWAGHTLAGAVIRHRGAIIPKAAMPHIVFPREI